MSAQPPEQTHYYDHIYLPAAHDRNARRTNWVIGLTSLTMVAEIAAGWLTGSMALLADGFHMATHAGALMIAGLAYAFARRQARNARFTFGTGKVGDLAGFASAILLAVASLGIAAESVTRLFALRPINYADATLVAFIGLAVNLVSAWMLMEGGQHGHDHAAHEDHGHRHGSHAAQAHGNHHSHGHGHSHADTNLRAAYLHVLADALTSLAAIAALLAGRYLGWLWLDPLIGIAGAIIIARWAWALMQDAAGILLDTAEPEHAVAIKGIVGQAGATMADLHVWRLGPHAHAAIVSLKGVGGDERQIRDALHKLPNFVHVTVERL